jgi:hypothetical protein
MNERPTPDPLARRSAGTAIRIHDLEAALDKIRIAIRLTGEQLAPGRADAPTDDTPTDDDAWRYLHTLARFVEAAGGSLSLTVTIPGLPPIDILPLHQ